MINSIINRIWRKLRYALTQGKLINKANCDFAMCRLKVYKDAELFIDKGTAISVFTSIGCRKKMHIGKYAQISQCCHISDFQHNYKFYGRGRTDNNIVKETIIHDNVWIGFGSCVISSEIGENSVIGANSVVINMKIPPNTIFVGDCRLDYKMKAFELNQKEDQELY